MHFFRVGAVKVNAVDGDSFAEIRLKAVYAHVHQDFQFVLIPFAGRGVGKIYKRHARLPHIPLPDVAVWPFQEIFFFHSFRKKSGFLPDVRVNPDADIQPFFLDSAEHSHGIGEHFVVPYKIAPVEAFHPEAVEMEGAQRNIAV